jgi:hypothetical protein
MTQGSFARPVLALPGVGVAQPLDARVAHHTVMVQGPETIGLVAHTPCDLGLGQGRLVSLAIGGGCLTRRAHALETPHLRTEAGVIVARAGVAHAALERNSTRARALGPLRSFGRGLGCWSWAWRRGLRLVLRAQRVDHLAREAQREGTRWVVAHPDVCRAETLGARSASMARRGAFVDAVALATQRSALDAVLGNHRTMAIAVRPSGEAGRTHALEAARLRAVRRVLAAHIFSACPTLDQDPFRVSRAARAARG